MPPWLVSAALADAPPPPPPVDEASEEVVVWGRAVEEARDAVIERLDVLGYDKKKERNGRTVFLNEASWKGKVVLYDDAYLQVRRTGPRFKELAPIGGTNIRPYPLCIVVPTACLSAGAWTLSESRWRGVEDDVAVAVGEPLSTLGDRLADQAIGRTLDALPVALEALWEDGQPLLSTEPLRSHEERRAELLLYWDSRTENAWGGQVRAIVASFVRAVVQDGEHPYEPAEMDAFDAARRSVAPFPWDVDSGEAAE
jgi:hypothetical protein